MDIRLIIKEDLVSLSDDEYQKFQSKLCPGVNNILGVRMPVLRNYLKNLLNKYSFSEIYDSLDSQYYEELILKGILIGKCRDVEMVKSYITSFVPLIDNWAVCDSFCSGLKIISKNKEVFRNFILGYLNSNKEFEVRFALVVILNYYIEREYLFDNFNIFNEIKLDDYYVSMALAWAISYCFIKFYDETVLFIKTSSVSDFVYNKSIQKACESYRLDSVKKDYLRSIKR